MERPYTVCHMLTSLDGKIDGEFFSAPESAPIREKYNALREFFKCDATLYGTTTMKGGFANGEIDELKENDKLIAKTDFIAPTNVHNYIISIDPEGSLQFAGPYLELKGRPKAHIIEALTEKVSNDYLAYLQDNQISYIISGKDRIDPALLLKKLKELFGIERLMIAGGGVTNWAFASEGFLDELSIVVAPVADGATGSGSVFEGSDFQFSRKPLSFTLKEIQPIEGDGFWIRYERKSSEKPEKNQSKPDLKRIEM